MLAEARPWSIMPNVLATELLGLAEASGLNYLFAKRSYRDREF